MLNCMTPDLSHGYNKKTKNYPRATRLEFMSLAHKPLFCKELCPSDARRSVSLQVNSQGEMFFLP